MKKIFTLIAASMMLSASAETLALYSDATNFLPAIPFNCMYVDEEGDRTQVMYPAADLLPMVGQQITAITFYTEEEGCELDGGLLDIFMGETDVNVITDYINEGMTKVGTFSFTKNPGEVTEVTVTFDTPYTYNGGNLIFENVVVEPTAFVYTYWTGFAPSYNNCMVKSFGAVMARAFLPKTTFTYGDDTPEPQYTRGDVDCDGNVGIADVTALVDYILSGEDSEVNLDAADCDENGIIGIADVTALVDFIINGTWE